jgi:hypothetical protein
MLESPLKLMGNRPNFATKLSIPLSKITRRIGRTIGFADDSFRDHGIEIVFQKTTDASFQIPVDNISSAAISKAAWTAHQDEEEMQSQRLSRSIWR